MAEKKVDSSIIKSMDYDSGLKRLAVTFNNGNVYHYHGVTTDAYRSLENASSVGSHFMRHFKNNYSWTKAGKAKK